MCTYDEFIELVSSRTSCRSFKPDHLNSEIVQKVIDAGIWSASAHNSQAVYFIHVKDERAKEALASRAKTLMGFSQDSPFDPFYGAPELVVTVARDTCFAPYDGSIAISHMMDAAHALGLGSCWVNTAQVETTSPDSVVKSICREAGLRLPVVGVGYLALGCPSGGFVHDVKKRVTGRSFVL